MSLLQQIAENLGATGPVGASWMQTIAIQEGATGPVGGSWIQAWADAVGVTGPIGGSWIQALADHYGVTGAEGDWLIGIETNTATPPPPPFDPDAQAYLDAVEAAGGTINETITDATGALFTDMKAAGLYSKTIAMYPYVGGVQNAHKLEGKNPGTYDITFTGGWTFNTLGSTPNGVNGWATNNMYLATTMTLNNATLFTYLGTDYSPIGAAYSLDFGTADSFAVNGLFALIGGNQVGGDSSSYFYNNDSEYSTRISFSAAVIPSGIGLFGYNRTSSTNFNIWRNGVKLATNTNVNTGVLPSVKPLYMPAPGSATAFDNVNPWSQRRHQFDWVGEGLTDVEAGDLQTIINTFQTALGRNVY